MGTAESLLAVPRGPVRTGPPVQAWRSASATPAWGVVLRRLVQFTRFFLADSACRLLLVVAIHSWRCFLHRACTPPPQNAEQHAVCPRAAVRTACRCVVHRYLAGWMYAVIGIRRCSALADVSIACGHAARPLAAPSSVTYLALNSSHRGFAADPSRYEQLHKVTNTCAAVGCCAGSSRVRCVKVQATYQQEQGGRPRGRGRMDRRWVCMADSRGRQRHSAAAPRAAPARGMQLSSRLPPPPPFPHRLPSVV